MKSLNNYNNFINENNISVGKFIDMVDFTFLRPTTKETITKFLEDAKKLKPYSVCVNSDYVDYAKYFLEETDIKIVSVLDFPNGNSKEKDKLSDAINLISDGVDEIDMVMNYKQLKKAYLEVDETVKQNMLDKVEREIKIVANECHKNGIILKVIIESGLLTYEELSIACELVTNGGADYIQTSTGNKKSGPELSKVKEIRRMIPDYMKIKVSGGIRTLNQCNLYFPYVDRIGTSIIPK